MLSTDKLPQIPSTTEHLSSIGDVLGKVPSLLTWPPGDISISLVSGRRTNTLYKLSCTSEAPVLVRIFGGEDIFTPAKRDQETNIATQLGEAGIGPKVRAKFANGRVETFLEARPLLTEEMTSQVIRDGVAQNMARLHAFQTIGIEPQPREVTLWRNTDRWSQDALSLARDGRFAHADIDLDRAMRGLKKADQNIGSSEIVFAHNDLHPGNILRSANGQITLIDFEYSDYNYSAYDIGNFFAEAMGGCDTGIVRTHQYPSLDFRRRFCSVYLEEFQNQTPSRKAVVDLVNEAERFVLATHLFWGFWALVQSANSAVHFPYVKYAKQRFDIFFQKYDWV